MSFARTIKSKLEAFGIYIARPNPQAAPGGFMLTTGAERSDLLRVISLLHPRRAQAQLIRLGASADGGYLVPDDLEGVVACFSPGVSETVAFEEEIYRRHGIRSFLADASVEAPPASDVSFDFTKKFVGSKPGAEYVELGEWVSEKVGSTTGDLLLQMDIEGSEFDFFTHASDTLLQRFRIIVLELHGMPNLFEGKSLFLYESLFRKMTKFHTVVHSHPNNCCGTARRMGVEIPYALEITLHRSDRVSLLPGPIQIPHPLDAPNLSSKPDLALPACWYRDA